MDGGSSLVAEEEKYFYPGELSYIEGAERGIGGERWRGLMLISSFAGFFLGNARRGRREHTLIPLFNTATFTLDSLGFHKVGNPDPVIGAVTLHCYIPPPRSARVWLPTRTAVSDAMTVPTCLYSAFGQRVKEGGREMGKEGPIITDLRPVGAGAVVGSPSNQA
jgi:hypothetical protein